MGDISDFTHVQAFGLEWFFPKTPYYQAGDYRVTLGAKNRWIAVFMEPLPKDRGGPIPRVLGDYAEVEQAMEHCALHKEYADGRKSGGAVADQWRDVYAKAQRSARRRLK